MFGEMIRLSSMERAVAAHVAPFVGWLFVIQMLGDPAGWKYAVRVAVGLGLLLGLKPWRGYARPQPGPLPLALGVGVAAFLLWVFPESRWMPWPGLQELYVRYAVLPWGELREAQTSWPYIPEVCGWPLVAVRLLGSAFVISVIEEFFWRGFLLRWMQGRNFLEVDPGRKDLVSWLLVSAVFGFEHAEWLAGIVAGLLYGWVYIRTRDIWAACAAHAVTNLLLGLYVLAEGAWYFW
jgi:hypothetical protein